MSRPGYAFRLPAVDVPQAISPVPATCLVKGAGQLGLSLLCDGVPNSTAILLAGHYISVALANGDEQLLLLLSDATSNGSGEVTLWRGDQLLTGPGTTFTADPDGGPLYALALTTVGSRTLLAVGGGAGAAGLWDVSAEPTRLADLRGGDGPADAGQ